MRRDADVKHAIQNQFNELDASLTPTFGMHHESQATFSTLLMHQAPISPGEEKLSSLSFEDIVLNKPKLQNNFNEPVEAIRLTYRQTWFIKGTEIGKILYSKPLAPGQVSYISVSQWSRKERGQQSENQQATEDLKNDASHQRYIDEINNAVSQELSTGFSHGKSQSTAEEKGIGGGLSLDFGGFGGSSSSASTNTIATNFMSGNIDRDFSAHMHQKILTKNQDHAAAVRNSNTLVIREVTQQESQQASSGVICNYNRYHPVTYNYYELAQIFQIDLQLIAVEKVLLIPIHPLTNFTDSIVKNYWQVLKNAALSKDVYNYLDAKFSKVAKTLPAFDLLAHLNEHKQHYSMAIYVSLDSNDISGVLANYRYENQPLVRCVKPKPVAAIGNLLGFSLGGMYATGNEQDISDNPIQTWVKKVMQAYGLNFEHIKSTIIKLPTQGVHLEGSIGNKVIENSEDFFTPTIVPQNILKESLAQNQNLQANPMPPSVVVIQPSQPLPNPTSQEKPLTELHKGKPLQAFAKFSKSTNKFVRGTGHYTAQNAAHAGDMALDHHKEAREGASDLIKVAPLLFGVPPGIPPLEVQATPKNSPVQPPAKKAAVPSPHKPTAKPRAKALSPSLPTTGPLLKMQARDNTQLAQGETRPNCGPLGYTQAFLEGGRNATQNSNANPLGTVATIVLGGGSGAVKNLAACFEAQKLPSNKP